MKLVGTILFAAVVIIAAHHDAEGQLLEEFRLGGKAGLNIANHVGPDADGDVVKSVNKLGYTIGGVGSYLMHRMLAVQVELLFSTKGRSSVASGRDYGGFDLYYIDLPILAKFEIPLELPVEPYLLAGAGMGILVHAIGEEFDGTRVDFTKNISTFDIGPIVGAGGAYRLGSRGAILFEARYFRGLTTLDPTGQIDYYNRTFTFMLGYQCCASAARK